jgi:subtilisin family serine protease
LTGELNQIGVALATSADPAFAESASSIPGLQGVAADRMLEVDPPQVYELEGELGLEGHGENETFWATQWATRAIHAPEAWHAGALGAGARVAILDSGIRNTHIDLAPNFDVARSRSFVPGFAFNQDMGTFWHGTHVAGIIAAADNGIGTIGVAPAATLIGIKVTHGENGSFAWLIQGLVYAATPIDQGGAGADVINMSLGVVIDPEGADDHLFLSVVGRAMTYAYQQSVTVIASAGNAAIDLDHTANLVHVPSQSPNVISVSATGPVGFALGATNFDRPASYTNFGITGVDLAAPGGDGVLPGSANCSLPAVPAGSITAPCWVFDLIMAPCRGAGASNGSYCFSAGTSMASPHVAGVAALIIGRNGGSMHPAQVEAALRKAADDLGPPARDPYYGHGRINALRAIQ